MKTVSEFDIEALKLIRQNVASFLSHAAKELDMHDVSVLDIAPHDSEGASAYFVNSKVQTLDINPNSGATFIADLCGDCSNVPMHAFDVIVCTEVLEHTLQPFIAVENLKSFLKPKGVLLITTPFNFRIHGPFPDCWRFTEFGLRELLKNFKIISIKTFETDRFLMPLQYSCIAKNDS